MTSNSIQTGLDFFHIKNTKNRWTKATTTPNNSEHLLGSTPLYIYYPILLFILIVKIFKTNYQYLTSFPFSLGFPITLSCLCYWKCCQKLPFFQKLLIPISFYFSTLFNSIYHILLENFLHLTFKNISASWFSFYISGFSCPGSFVGVFIFWALKDKVP